MGNKLKYYDKQGKEYSESEVDKILSADESIGDKIEGAVMFPLFILSFIVTLIVENMGIFSILMLIAFIIYILSNLF